MSNVLRMRWTLAPLTPPRPLLNCSRCGGTRPFRSSGKVRLNANGKRLDAWLIYKCRDCDGSWNRPLFERRNVRDLDPETLGALETSASKWVERRAFDLADLKRSAGRVEPSGESRVEKRTLSEPPPPWSSLEIVLEIAAQTAVRLDR